MLHTSYFDFERTQAGLKALGVGAVTRTLLLEDLLEQQERNIHTMDIVEENVELTLNINKLIHLINSNFLAK